MTGTITVDDFVMLGTTVPEETRSDGRRFVCSAGVSPTLRTLTRVYPLAMANVPRRWHRFRIALERNPSDSRHESFKIAGDRSADVHWSINSRFEDLGEVPERERAELLKPFVRDSIAAANRLQTSLAVIEPRDVQVYLKRVVEDDQDSPQLCMFDTPAASPTKPGARFEWMPRVAFRDREGWHDLQVRDWGVYELMRKRGYEYVEQHLARALHLTGDSSLLVGNQTNRRTSWLVISVVNHVRAQMGFFDRSADEIPFIPTDVRARVMARDENTCQMCGGVADALDHIWPASRGGLPTEENLRAICSRCNSQKGDQVA